MPAVATKAAARACAVPKRHLMNQHQLAYGGAQRGADAKVVHYSRHAGVVEYAWRHGLRRASHAARRAGRLVWAVKRDGVRARANEFE